MRWVTSSGLAAVCLCASGCQAMLDNSVGRAPNEFPFYRRAVNVLQPQVESHNLTAEFLVPVGPPTAEIWIGIVDPPVGTQPTATVLILHGVFTATSRSPNNEMLGKAESLAHNGYRAVLVDLRGHGRSTGEFITQGPLESRDLSQVIDALERSGWAVGRIGIVGFSLGAAVGIHTAEIDPRVATVVAVAAPVCVREALPNFAWTAVPFTQSLFSCEDFQRAIDEAARRYGQDPDEGNPLLALGNVRVPVLLIHTTDDGIAPPENGRRLSVAAQGNTEFVVLPGKSSTQDSKGHTRLISDDSGQVESLTLSWFSTYLGP